MCCLQVVEIDALYCRAESSAHWATTVDAYSEAGGLNVRIPKVAIPEFRKSQADGDVVSTLYTDPQLLLKKHLPGSIELSGVLSEFKAFEGTWQSVYPGTSAYTLAQPVFNKKGDILFELRPYSQLSASVSFVPPSYSRRASGAITSRSPSAVRRPSNFARGSSECYRLADQGYCLTLVPHSPPGTN